MQAHSVLFDRLYFENDGSGVFWLCLFHCGVFSSTSGNENAISAALWGSLSFHGGSMAISLLILVFINHERSNWKQVLGHTPR